MGAEGSIGTPSYKQIIMQKKKKNVREGVRISGYDAFQVAWWDKQEEKTRRR